MAGVYFIRPDGDIKVQWTETPDGTAFSTIDESVFNPTVPTLTDYISDSTLGHTATFSLGTFTLPKGEAIRRGQVWVYGVNASGGRFSAALTRGDGSSLGATIDTTSTSAGWLSSSFSTAGLTQSDIDGLRLTFATLGNALSTVYAAYVAFSTHDAKNLPLLGVG